MVRWSPAQRLGLDRAAVASLLSLLAVGCGAGTDVPTSPLDSPAAASDTGTVYGQVVAPVGQSATGRPQGFGAPVGDATVELGIWRSSAGEFRDSAARAPRLRPDDPRFKVVARVVTNHLGEYRFPGLPKKQVFAVRIRPPAGSAYEVTYFESLFWLFRSAEMRLSLEMRRSSQ
jgi:hypothetical protein